MKKYFLNIIVLLSISFSGLNLHADRIKDMASVAGVRSNQLVGYGLVIGLAKTGDGSVNLTKQSIAAMISQFGVIANTADIDASNALPPNFRISRAAWLASLDPVAIIPYFIFYKPKLDI